MSYEGERAKSKGCLLLPFAFRLPLRTRTGV